MAMRKLSKTCLLVNKAIIFYSILFYSILFYSILFYSIIQTNFYFKNSIHFIPSGNLEETKAILGRMVCYK
jgi:hypothetical protein